MAFSGIVKTDWIVEPMDRFTALNQTLAAADWINTGWSVPLVAYYPVMVRLLSIWSSPPLTPHMAAAAPALTQNSRVEQYNPL